ncbi:hypothetical protein TrVFT333_003545 [Trichoderma virens FT-333]|nr:hypothetical protein TrVFT333_003545 [Trichoderma virens FT-333]
MAYSLTVAALLHPWSGRIDLVSRLPLRRNEWAISNKLPITVERCPSRAKKSKTRHKNLSIDFSWVLDQQGDGAESEVAEEEESISSATETRSDILSSDDATCECSEKTSELLEMQANDTRETQKSADNTEVDLEILKAIKALPIPPAILKTSSGPMYHNEYFKVAKSSVAGWGAFATRDLTKGAVILRETPLFVAETDNVFHEFYKLDGDAKKVALSLHAHRLIKGGTPLILAIWQTNCFSVSRHAAGLFPIAARFNHACDPVNNVEYEFDHDNGVLRMMVREDITAGTELKISYGKNLSPQDLYFARRRKKYCDFELACDDGRTIPVHKFIIFSQSEEIEGDCTWLGEEASGRYVIKGYSFEDVQRMVDYLYTGDYHILPPPTASKQEKFSNLIIHGNMMRLASYYGFLGLRDISKNKCSAAIRDEESVCALIAFIPKVYQPQNRNNRDFHSIVVESISERIANAPLDPEIKGSLNRIMGEVPDFARDLAMSLLQRLTPEYGFRSGSPL